MTPAIFLAGFFAAQAVATVAQPAGLSPTRSVALGVFVGGFVTFSLIAIREALKR